ncbi:hypothetical protein SAMN05216321_10827 [Cupriavidus sp. OV038]|jgi:hypothetical protein|uniref:DUF5908 family protein n=1 Tax=unclassified Cupriavidus TaxID=2640874 RepID=UPI0008E7A74C|nr:MULTISPECIES: DUF5908 family protein [unclassified Cupriavidus]SFC89595.1 hypothetical protein SAMN05216321_10827 [Cupriavidus sp. OV038]SFP53519.1 hypothetical protein SAMN05216322_10727 [Cupriavidus sp. OV096]
MTIEVRQMVIRSELGNGQRGAAPARAEAEPDPAQCCDEDEAASTRHREQRAQLRMLRAQLARLRER